MRELRSYEYVARKEHFCDYCFYPIVPGTRYQGVVYATDKSIFVLKEHKYPSCPVHPDDIWKEMLEDSETSRDTCTIDKLVIDDPQRKVA